MRWCLAEAKRTQERAFMRKCEAICIHQDVRERILLIRYVAVNGSMNEMRGTLGVARDPGGGHVRLRDATLKAYKRFCTICAGRPASTRAGRSVRPPRLDKQLLDRMVEKTQLANADSAGDEQLALDMLEP